MGCRQSTCGSTVGEDRSLRKRATKERVPLPDDRVKNYARSNTSEGFSVGIGTSIHVGDFPDNDGDTSENELALPTSSVEDVRPEQNGSAVLRRKTSTTFGDFESELGETAPPSQQAHASHAPVTRKSSTTFGRTLDTAKAGTQSTCTSEKGKVKLSPRDRVDIDELIQSILVRLQNYLASDDSDGPDGDDESAKSQSSASRIRSPQHLLEVDFRNCAGALLTDKCQLLRILIARKRMLEPSTDLFFEQVRFRTRWRPDNIGPDDIPNALPSGAWRLCGYSREGCIMSNYKLRCWNPNAYGRHAESKVDRETTLHEAVNEYVRYVVYTIELMIAKMHPPPVMQQFVVLFDLAGWTPSLIFRRNVRVMILKLIYVAQAQYPERLRKVMLLNAPFGFGAAWKLIRPLLDEKTASKISFANMSDLTLDVDVSVLPREYGGTHPEYPLLLESGSRQN